jgi:hypothetical protein
MSATTRRALLRSALALPLAGTAGLRARRADAAGSACIDTGLASITGAAKPISTDERHARMAKLQGRSVCGSRTVGI